MGTARKLRTLMAITTGALALGAAPAAAEEFTVTTHRVLVTTGPDDDVPCIVIGDLYKPASATRANPAPAILTTNGFGGSKNDQAASAKAYAARGYVVFSYSGLGFGGSQCKITLDDRDTDGKAGSQLISFLGGSKADVDGKRIDVVKLDAVGQDGKSRPDDPRVGMIGGSYGGQVQFAVAGIDPRLDTIIPIITWNDLAYSLAPNNTSFSRGVTYQTPGVEKFDWVSLFFAVGIQQGLANAANDPRRNLGQCPNFDDRACAAKAQMDATGAPNDTTISFARHASVGSFLDDIRIPTLLAQGQADTLFNLQESVATYEGLKARKVPVKLMWQSWGHSTGAPKPGEYDPAKPDTNYQGRQFLAWFDHYLKDSPAAPSLDFTFFRDFETYSGDATPAYGRAASYPVAAPRELFLSGTNGLVSSAQGVAAGAAAFTTPAAGAPTSFTEISAVDQSRPVTDAPGTFAQFATPPLTQDTDVVGVPSVRLRLDAPAAAGGLSDATALTLFFKLYDLAPDGTIRLMNRLISPVRVTNPTVPLEVELPGIVQRFPKGHRIALTIAGSDAAYKGNNTATPVSILTDKERPGVLRLPVAPVGTYGKVVEAKAAPVLSAKRCGSRRAFTVNVRSAFRGKLRSAAVFVAAKRVATLRPGRTSTRVNLKGRTRSTVVVRIVMTLKNGRKVTDTRRYRVCAKR